MREHGERVRVAAKRRGRQLRAQAEAVALPRGATRSRSGKRVRSRLLPSTRSLLVGLAIAAAGIGAYVLARETSAFAIRQVEVSGVSGPVAVQVQQVLRPFVGTSLVGLSGGKVESAVEGLPSVVSASYDRAFPHTLKITVVAEHPVAVVRRGAGAWLVSARGRVVERVARNYQPALPRIWLPLKTDLSAGAFLVAEQGGDAARALSFTSRFPFKIRSVANAAGSLVFHLDSGIDLRLGDASDMPLKLAVARRALRQLPTGATYLDVGLPERPVAGSGALPPSAQAVPTPTPAPTAAATTTSTTTTPSATTTTNPQVSG